MKGTTTAEVWESSTDYREMARAVAKDPSTRKAYCIGLGCLRLIWDRIPPGPMRQAVKVTERYVERKATNADRARARALLGHSDRDLEMAVYWAVAAPTDIRSSGRGSVQLHVRFVLHPGSRFQSNPPVIPYFSHVFREVYPNPFRPVKIEPAWLRWNDGTVRHIAEAINDEGDFERVGVLADALEEAGCDNEHILGHLRGPGPHVRGCWPVDLILKKK